MAPINFFIGLGVGLGICAAQQYRYKNQLKRTLSSYTADGDVSLPLHSLIRRELFDLDRQRQKLEKDQQSWQDLIEQAPIGYLRVNATNQLLECNQTAKDFLRIDSWRYDSQPPRIRLLLELVRSYDLDSLIEATRSTHQPQQKEWIFYCTRYAAPQNIQLNAEINTNPPSKKIVESIALKGYGFPLSNGEVGVFIENQQPLWELSKSRDRTFADLAHELRTPLTSISLVAENLLVRLQNPEHRWVEQMLQEVHRLIELVQEWLDLTQLKASPNRSLKYESIQLYDLIQSVWRTLEPIAKKQEVTLTYTGDTQTSLAGDRSRLIQVFLNLLDNAIKYNPPQKEILVQVSSITSNETDKIDYIKIDVIDSGVGFKTSDLPHIFERLYRADKSRTRNQLDSSPISPDGSGLGLAIVEQIVQAHGGAIAAKNHSAAGGAWLEIVLPISKNRQLD